MPCFNPRVREGRDTRPDARRRQCACFNPRVREGRDELAVVNDLEGEVSIHASVKDATGGSHFLRHGSPVSIHASVKDATRVPPLA